MGLFDRLKNLIRPKQARIASTSIVGYDTSLVYIPEYESLSDKQKKQVDEYAKSTKIESLEDVVFYGEGVSKYSTGITELLLSMLYKSTDEIKVKNIDRMSEKERTTTRVEAKLTKEQIKYLNQALQNVDEEVVLRAVALKKVFEEHRKSGKVFGKIFKHPVQEITQRRFEHARFSEALERMKILKKIVEQQQMAVTNATNNMDIIEQTIRQLEALEGDKDKIESQEILDRKRQEILKMAALVLPKEDLETEESKEEDAKIKNLAKIKVKLELYAFKNKDQIDDFRKKVEELRTVEKTDKNKEELLHKIEELEIRYKIFGRYIKDEDWESLYRTKFDILVYNINKQEDNPINYYDLEKEDSREFKAYIEYINEKMNNIFLGKNKEIERAFLDGQVSDEMNRAKTLGEVIETIKKIIRDLGWTNRFDARDILANRDLLSLILAFDKPRGIEELTVRNNHLIRYRRA